MMEKADPAHKLFNRMRLWEFPDQYVVEPTDGSSAPFLVISRLDGSMNLTEDITDYAKFHVPRTWTIYGVVGTVKLIAGSYLLVITERECVGSYMGYPIFKITSLKIFPCDHSLNNAPEEQKKMEIKFCELLRIAERTPGLYFSYDVNITLSTQRLHDLGEESKLLPLWKQADPQFIWNRYILEVLIDNKLDPYLLPVMQGSFQSFKYSIGKDVLDLTLIARRCTRRIGTRMWRRGADSDGFVANFVETEQIIQVNGHTASFVQVRGSIPLLWDQIVDITYKPKFNIIEVAEVSQVVERHFCDLRKKYGNVQIVNLVNKHGGEGDLCGKFGRAIQSLARDDVRYMHFDFHRICGDNDIEWISILYHRIETYMLKNRCLLLNDKGEKIERQVGVVRTNCIDCLDRTNVTQSMIARKMLESQLRRLGVFNTDETIRRHPKLDQSFKNLWANHGDDISIQYTGTPALKGDFVRIGQRTVLGMLKDGRSSLLRYYLNNFRDGTKQDAIDLLQGHYIVSVSRSMLNTKKEDGIEAIASIQLALLLVTVGFFFAAISLRRARRDPWNLLFSIMWTCVSLAIASLVKSKGRTFCNRPRLHPPR
ncbi:Phosphoinositide phosphatase SAC7 [Striga hermonthica]|uniref:Phosphoinositide phosphatase SAC7 n=1 Tax=Striga hermonthica TaxID=68872 RepID=A0A9N7MP54_STRHE|nr:Phosphoinositide phosphatase SAC7 [Striga hermonthica]